VQRSSKRGVLAQPPGHVAQLLVQEAAALHLQEGVCVNKLAAHYMS
jgi:hypothetical protein